MPQSLGIIGGKTNQALYLFGYVGDDILYLDPHTTQKSGSIENKLTEEQQEMDNSYHCKYASRMPILNMDPSVAVVRRMKESPIPHFAQMFYISI